MNDTQALTGYSPEAYDRFRFIRDELQASIATLKGLYDHQDYEPLIESTRAEVAYWTRMYHNWRKDHPVPDHESDWSDKLITLGQAYEIASIAVREALRSK